MITYQEALEKILASIVPMPVGTVSLEQLLGKIIAAPVVATIDSPPFDNSAVDGFGVLASDVAAASDVAPVSLAVKATVRAGDAGSVQLRSGSALKILTGGVVPFGVEAVVMKEFCSETNGCVQVRQAVQSGENIRRRGAEFVRGHSVLSSGSWASPPVVALIASLGYKEFRAFRSPRAAVVTTGNELTKPGRTLMPGHIFDSNSFAMQAALHSAGISEVIRWHAREEEADTVRMFRRALDFADVVVSTGGVSVGDFDFVKSALERLAVKTEIWRIAIKPGKPVYFGLADNKYTGRTTYVFGLPGNPVSALVTYNLLVLPALAKLMGLSPSIPLLFTARLTASLKKKAGRAEFIRGRLRSQNGELLVEPTTGQDSHMLSGLAQANALITFPLEAEALAAGALVETRLLDWSLAGQARL